MKHSRGDYNGEISLSQTGPEIIVGDTSDLEDMDNTPDDAPIEFMGNHHDEIVELEEELRCEARQSAGNVIQIKDPLMEMYEDLGIIEDYEGGY